MSKNKIFIYQLQLVWRLQLFETFTILKGCYDYSTNHMIFKINSEGVIYFFYHPFGILLTNYFKSFL